MTEKQPQYYTLDIPQREGKEGYIGTLLGLFLKMGGIMAQSDFSETDKRIEYMTQFLISMVPGRKLRKEIRDALKKDIEERTKGLTKNEDKARERNLVCLEYIGEVMDWTDKHIGVTKENKVGFVV